MENGLTISWFVAFVIVLVCSIFSGGQIISNNPQQSSSTTETAQVPLVIRFSGRLRDVDEKQLVGLTGLTFSLYTEQAGGAPLWTESQNVMLDSQGRFTVLLGSSAPNGLPIDLFASREAHWLGITADDGIERPRTLLVSVPYALEAANAETFGGRRPEEFVSAIQNQQQTQKRQAVRRICFDPLCPPIVQSLPSQALSFEATSSVGPSFISDAITGPPFLVRSPEVVPLLNADLFHGLSPSDFAQVTLPNQFTSPQIFNQGLSLVPTPTATTAQDSPPLDFLTRGKSQNRLFRFQAEPGDSAQGTLDRWSFLSGFDTTPPAETGLSINSDGTINFATNQQLPASALTAALSGLIPGTESNAYQWRQVVTSAGIVPGLNTISLAQCPPGVIGSDPSLSIYISGTGVPEAVQVTGGTCKGDGQPGTVQFVAANSHPPGYAFSSASSGIQEAIVASNAKTKSASIVIPPGEYPVYAQIAIHASNVTINFSGAVLDCYVNASCIHVGDVSSSSYQHVTLVNPTGKPMVPYGTNAFIEVNANQTKITNIATAYSSPPNSFGSYVQVDDDQSFSLDGLDSNLGYGIRCDANYCGSYIVAPGPFNVWSAVGSLTNLNISAQCDGNGIDWQSGNGLTITNSVIQSWSQFGVRVGHKRGGFGGFISNGVHYEPSPSCIPYNPLGNVGLAGIIDQGGQMDIEGVPSNSVSGVFPNWGSASGSAKNLYWVAPVSAAFGEGIPLPAGYAFTNGPATVVGTFPKIAGAASYKILKITSDPNQAPPYPEGTGNYLLAVVQQSSCSKQTCQFIDSGQVLSRYSNAGENFSVNIYMPLIDFWPGAIIVGQAQDLSSASGAILTPLLTADTLGEGSVVSTMPAAVVTGQAQTLIPTAVPVPAAAVLSGMNTTTSYVPGGTILKAFLSIYQPSSGLKGRLNFGSQGSSGGFSPLITIADSNFGKTWATPSARPTADVGDLDVGYEGTMNTYYQRAATEIRQYIGKFPDGNPQESLTGTSKTLNVPVTINGPLTVTGGCTGCGGNGDGGGTGTGGSNGKNESVSRAGLSAELLTRVLCNHERCPAGQYVVSHYLDSSSSCELAGDAEVTLTLSWKDETSARSLTVPLSGLGVSESVHLSLGNPANFGGGEFSFWSRGTPILYSTSYVPCSQGTGAYSLRISLTKQ